MSGEVDRVRANEAALEAAKSANREKQFGKTEFSQLDWIKLNEDLRRDRETGELFEETKKEKFSRKFGHNPFVFIGEYICFLPVE